MTYDSSTSCYLVLPILYPLPTTEELLVLPPAWQGKVRLKSRFTFLFPSNPKGLPSPPHHILPTHYLFDLYHPPDPSLLVQNDRYGWLQKPTRCSLPQPLSPKPEKKAKRKTGIMMSLNISAS